jgi:hypothetical protein
MGVLLCANIIYSLILLINVIINPALHFCYGVIKCSYFLKDLETSHQ